jgi:hypothetical protein
MGACLVVYINGIESWQLSAGSKSQKTEKIRLFIVYKLFLPTDNCLLPAFLY